MPTRRAQKEEASSRHISRARLGVSHASRTRLKVLVTARCALRAIILTASATSRQHEMRWFVFAPIHLDESRKRETSEIAKEESLNVECLLRAYPETGKPPPLSPPPKTGEGIWDRLLVNGTAAFRVVFFSSSSPPPLRSRFRHFRGFAILFVVMHRIRLRLVARFELGPGDVLIQSLHRLDDVARAKRLVAFVDADAVGGCEELFQLQQCR